MNRPLHALVPVAAAAALAAAAPEATAPSEPKPEARGEALVQLHCGGCHAVRREGASREPAAPPFRELHTRYDPEMLSEALAEGILTGHPLMPEFRFAPDDVRAIILYLQSIQTRRPA